MGNGGMIGNRGGKSGNLGITGGIIGNRGRRGIFGILNFGFKFLESKDLERTGVNGLELILIVSGE